MLGGGGHSGKDRCDPLRVIAEHMIEKAARHAGHADILREQVDGVTGSRRTRTGLAQGSAERRDRRDGLPRTSSRFQRPV
ncbi:putative DUF664 family protein [Actinoalloteichus sp. GBA129-24]|uniref:DUF664 family protein n=1 Tax=Actinoalloteichus fjordicus TaxID=1612552 RepID=A0AAC9LGW5_9PSEU|nr:putative DUF664 family protein [Actinoalloteichus fjordicus]APU22159.1 putative DUF664 family protein [Actinoalloteichus sp. GBA129-24]